MLSCLNKDGKMATGWLLGHFMLLEKSEEEGLCVVVGGEGRGLVGCFVCLLSV